MMKVLLVSLSILFFGLQYKLWLGERSIRVLKNLEVELALQLEHNESLESRNARIETEIMNLKNLAMWAIIVLLSVGLFNMFQEPN